MRKLFKKRLLGIPVAALLILALTAGVVMAAYPVVSGTVTVGVNEAFTVEYSLDSTNGSDGTWLPVTDGFAEAITGAYPGDCYTVWVEITNASSNTLWGRVNVVPRTPAAFDITSSSNLFSSTGVNIPTGSFVRSFTACVEGDAAPNTYTIDISVERDDPTV